MKNLLFALVVSTIAPFAYCAPARVALPVDRVEISSSYFIFPKIGDVASAEVGDSLYKEGVKSTTKRYIATLREDAVAKMDNGYTLSAKAGTKGPMLMRPESKMPLLCLKTESSGASKFFGDANVIGCFADERGNQTFNTTMYPQYWAFFRFEKAVPYDVEIAETVAENHDDFFVDVLYQGVSKGEVKISYREFSGGMSRPAFTQDVSYELSPNGTATIGFKGMRIKVLKANSEKIEYILDQPMPSLSKYRTQASIK